MYKCVYMCICIYDGILLLERPWPRPKLNEFSICIHTLVLVLKLVFAYKFYESLPTAIDFERARVLRTDSSRNLLL